MRLATVAMLALAACDSEGGFESVEHANKRHAKEAEERWSGPCHDEATLLATTSGSPNGTVCTNKLHRMEVQVATHPSNEEAAALVFCRCVRDGEERDR